MLTYIEVIQRKLQKEQKFNKKQKDKHAKSKQTRRYFNHKAGKGGAVVIVDVKDYIKEAEWLLTNIKNYRKLQKDPTATNMKLVNDTIERLKK